MVGREDQTANIAMQQVCYLMPVYMYIFITYVCV